MSYAVGTPHYNLPQTTGNDKRDWFDTNQAFLALDGDVYGAKTTADSVAQDMSDVVQSVANLSTRVGTAEGDIDNLESGLATANENIGINATAIGNLSTQLGDVKQDVKDAICSIEETSATAQYRHEVGTFFWYNDTLYKTTVLIPVGNTIVPNTNCETTNVTTELLNGGGGSGVEIDDTSISTGKVWSSSKTNAEIQGAVAVQAGDTRYSNGKLQYYNGTSWVDVQIGGTMPELDFANAEVISTTQITTDKNGAIHGVIYASGGIDITVGNVVYHNGSTNPLPIDIDFIPAGTSISLSIAQAGTYAVKFIPYAE